MITILENGQIENTYLVEMGEGTYELTREILRELHLQGVEINSRWGVTPIYEVYTEDGITIMVHTLQFTEDGAEYELLGSAQNSQEMYDLSQYVDVIMGRKGLFDE